MKRSNVGSDLEIVKNNMSELPAIAKSYDITNWLLNKVESFPRNKKFTLGDRIVNLTLDIMEALIEAAYSPDKTSILKQANLRLEKLRYLIRLCVDNKIIAMNSYEYISKEIDQLGRQVGGWLKTKKGQ
tara:strand:- start:233 stop:619 length:387 start_codon:yes stop_codon:yes gene_type:complete